MKINAYYITVLIFLLAAGCAAGESTPAAPRGDMNPTTASPPATPVLESIAGDEVAGVVLDQAGLPLKDAVVRLQATELSAVSDAAGEFLLQGVPRGKTFRLTAYTPGYFIKEADARAGQDDVAIALTPHAADDNQEYEFLTAGAIDPAGKENSGCAKCHAATAEEAARGITLPYDQWLLDAHAQSVKNPRFVSMYLGTDLAGSRSPLTTYVDTRDYGRIPLPPQIDAAYHGPGFKLDFPKSSGNCATCHAPVAAVDAPYDVDPSQVSGVGLEGGNCDFCHKVWDVKLDPATKMPSENTPGVLSMDLRRPSGKHQLFIGPYDDVAPGEDTYSALQNKSDYCAACHTGSFWDVKIYNSYGEWLASPYSDPAGPRYKTCQDCHMPPNGADHFAQIERGGLARDSATIFTHKMLGASDASLLQNSARLEVKSSRQEGLAHLNVSVFNENGGHDIPTDSPLRQIFLIVRAVDGKGRALPLVSGPALPKWSGEYAGAPGIYFAKILEELWTDVSPSGAYWMQTRLVEDTRLHALETRKAEFVFQLPEGEPASVTVSLVYRRAFADLMDQKGWTIPDILMEEEKVELK